MTDTNADTATSGQADPAAASAAAAPDPRDVELASLRSRNSGLNAKVGELTNQLTTVTGERDTARAGLTDKSSADEDLRRQLAEAQQSIQTLTQANKAAALSQRFPEAAKELGDGIFAIGEERLAAIEARLSGAKDAKGSEEPPETPRPVGNNQQRDAGAGSKSIEDQSVEELRKSLRDMPREAFGLASE